MNIILAMLRRDILIELRYRFNLAAKALNSIFYLTVFYFVGALVPQGGYFPFVFAGIVFSRFFAVCVGAGAEMVRNEQYWGTAENLFLSPANPALIVLSATASRLALALAEFALMALVGIFIFGVRLSPLAALIFPLALMHAVMFTAIGLISAGFIMFYKRGDPAGWLLGIAVDLASGVYFPVTLLPGPLKFAAVFLPTTMALDSWRLALLEGAFPSMASLASQSLWAGLLFVCGWQVFGICFNGARRNASVGSY
jgi:ABC-2 type transport system permease protein